MNRLAIVLGLAVLGACQPTSPPVPVAVAPAAKPAAAPDASPPPAAVPLVLPGDYSQSTTVADFEKRFGKENVRIAPDPDDAEQRSIVLFPDDPKRRAVVTFHDGQALTDVAGISVTDADSLWRGKHGVRVGMTFAEVRALNGKPFGFYGFDSQRRGYAHDQWSPALDDDDAKLGAFDVDEGEHMYFGIDFGIRSADVPASAFPVDEWLSSDDPRFPRLGEIVVVTGFNATTSLDDEWD